MKEKEGGNFSETPISPEKLIIRNKHGILVYGSSGTGKSSSIKLLSQRLQLSENNIHYTGKKFREHHKASEGKDFIGIIERDESFDRKIDNDHIEYILTAAKENRSIITEGRLSPLHGILAQNFARENKLPVPQTYTILFSMRDPEKRFYGLYKREQELNDSVTRDQVKELTLQREAADLERWDTLYPNFIYPYSMRM